MPAKFAWTTRLSSRRTLPTCDTHHDHRQRWIGQKHLGAQDRNGAEASGLACESPGVLVAGLGRMVQGRSTEAGRAVVHCLDCVLNASPAVPELPETLRTARGFGTVGSGFHDSIPVRSPRSRAPSLSRAANRVGACRSPS